MVDEADDEFEQKIGEQNLNESIKSIFKPNFTVYHTAEIGCALNTSMTYKPEQVY